MELRKRKRDGVCMYDVKYGTRRQKCRKKEDRKVMDGWTL